MILVFEIGSTTTLVNAFTDLDTEHPRWIGGGQAPTSVQEGDVTIGLREAIADMEKNSDIRGPYEHMLATSSAAGGLRMSVHGLVHDMTVRAAREAALGAGANLKLITSGRLRPSDLKKIRDLHPNIMLLAGGVDYGERDTAIYNAEKILSLDLDVPLIYAGNVENQDDIAMLFEEAGKSHLLYLVENVYPSIDRLNVEPTRAVIQQVFEEHIIHAQGMEKIRDMVDSSIIPTPGAVMLATELFYEAYGDVMTLDVGGATTDVHSVTEGSDEINTIQISPEPKAKRTVEGDLGLYVNRENLLDLYDREKLAKKLGFSEEEMQALLEGYGPIPKSEQEKRIVHELTNLSVMLSSHRHAGGLTDLFFTGGKKSVAEGKDLTMIRNIIGTGGALTQLDNTKPILEHIALSNKGDKLLPREGACILIDHHYIMASLGVLSTMHPQSALKLLMESLEDLPCIHA